MTKMKTTQALLENTGFWNPVVQQKLRMIEFRQGLELAHHSRVIQAPLSQFERIIGLTEVSKKTKSKGLVRSFD